MENKVQFGLSNVYYAEVLEQDGVTTYGKPFKGEGAVSMTATPTNTEVKFEADNNPNYFVNYANDGYTLELSMATISDEFKTKFLGYKKDKNGLIAEDTSSIAKPFALMFEVGGDAEAVRCIYYRCTAGRPTLAPKTGTTPEAQVVPVTVGKPADSQYSFSYCRKTENPTAYDEWYNTVQKFVEGV
ncbi:MAG: major tail protein [Anaerovorax sp.]|nr:major tail protein [Anaerovorax sp.]